MQFSKEIFTKDMARRIYYDLKEDNSGQLPFDDFKLSYTLNKKGEDNEPLEVDLKVINENGEEKSDYYMKFEDGFANYRIIQGNQIVKR